MRETRRAMGEILEHLRIASKKLTKRQVDGFIRTLLAAQRVFVVGAGRSGMVMKAFAMRLMHLDMDVYVVGETITPALRTGDVLVALSGSGETDLIVEAARIAKKVGAKIVAITSYPKSSLARFADSLVILPGRTKVARTTRFMKRELAGEYASLAPLGTLFEVTALVFLDGVIASLMVKLGRKEEELKARHATIE
ncbi:MAG: 6-phospho-3-hexuloisomerase [Candidatus Hodarchaeaceae archaeon]|nr:6-phospho-3-hexuloisomerase [Candidatus Hodarchaeaceae archaeon]